MSGQIDIKAANRKRALMDARGEQTFRIDRAARTITCLCCGMTSHNVNDITNRWCGYCETYHTDERNGQH